IGYSLPVVLLAGAPASDDQLVAGLVGLAGAAFGLAPRAHRVTAAGGLALAAAVRVVDRVHHDAADGGALAFPSHTSGLAPVDVRLLGVADLTDRGPASHVNTTDLAAGHTQRRVGTFLAEQLNARPGRTGQLRAAPGTQLDGMDQRAGRDVAQRQVVTWLDVGVGTRLDHVALRKTLRCNDVTLLAVQVMQQCDARGAVGVVLDVRDLGVDTVLVVAPEVDHPVRPLVAAALVSSCDAAVRVSPTATMQGAHQRLLRRRPGDLGEVRDAGAATTGRRGLVLANCHV